MSDSTYNGYTNYETWNVALYLDNEYPLYLATQDILRTAPDKSAAQYKIMMLAKRNVRIMDISRTDLALVNWDELGDFYWNEYVLQNPEKEPVDLRNFKLAPDESAQPQDIVFVTGAGDWLKIDNIKRINGAWLLHYQGGNYYTPDNALDYVNAHLRYVR